VPRIADPALYEKILDAAHRLATSKGIDAVTLRSVASLARTTTPTVYARFATREELLLALANRTRLIFAGEVMREPSLSAAARKYLQIAKDRPQDYRLIYEVGWPTIFKDDSERPAVKWATEMLAKLHGGAAADYRFVADSLWLQLHGGASFLSKSATGKLSRTIHECCIQSCEVIIRNAKQFKPK
jgi:AcrR family transcriptional regulator